MEGSKSQLERSEGQPERSKGQLYGSEGQRGCTEGQTDGQKFIPLPPTPPTGAAAKNRPASPCFPLEYLFYPSIPSGDDP